MNKSNLIGPALAFGLSCICSQARADSFSIAVNLDPGITLGHTYFAYDSDVAGTPVIQVLPAVQITGGNTTVLTGTSDKPFLATDAYTLFGDYFDANGEHLAIALNTIGTNLTNGQPYDSTVGALTGVSEATVLSYLDASSPQQIDTFIQIGWPYAKNYLPTVGSTGTVMGFSNGTPIGTTSPVPEPAPLCAFGLGATILICRRRRS